MAVDRSSFGIAECVALGNALWRQPARVGPVAAPVGELLKRLSEDTAGGVGPARAFLDLESLDVGQPAVLVALQTHAAAARHLRHLLDRKDQHLAIFADRGNEIALDRRNGARLIGWLDVENLLALAGIGKALVLGRNESPALAAGNDQLASALITEHPHDIDFLFSVSK